MRTRRFLGVCVPVLLSATACLRGNDGDGAGGDGPAPPWAFVNADGAEAFAPKLAKLGALLAAAARTMPARARPQSCATPVGLLGLAAPLTPPAHGLTLAEGMGCADAVAGLRAYYVRSLGVAGLSADLVRTLKPDVIFCGQRVVDTKPPAALAAVGRRLEAIDLPTAGHSVTELLGGSNGDAMALRSHVLAGCDTAAGDCGKLPEGVRGWAVEGVTETTADLDAKTLTARNLYTLGYKLAKDAGTGTLAGQLASRVTMSGLGPGESAKAVEHTRYAAAGTGAPGLTAAGDGGAALDLTVEEVSPGKLRLTGSAFAGAGTPEQEPFEFALTERDGGCAVDADTLPLSEGEPEPVVALEPAMMAGDWTSACLTGALGRFGRSAAFQETLSFHDQRFAHRLVPYTDTDCYTGHEAARVELFGTYAAAPLAAPVTDLALDYSYETLAITVVDAATVDAFNQGAVCGRHDWQQNETRSFQAAECYLDLGTAALMHLDSLKRKKEFTAARAANPAVIDVARTSHFGGDLPELRATVTAGASRKFRKQ